MKQALSNRALRVSVAKGTREMTTVTLDREVARILRLQAGLRQAVNGGGHAHQNMGEAIGEAVLEMVRLGRWSDY